MALNLKGIMMNREKSILISIAIAGATAMAAQIIFLREFLVVFYGNEISVGIILAGWLAWGAIGSLVLGRLADTVRLKIRLFYLCQISLAVALPLVLIGIRVFRSFIGISTGEIAGYAPMLLATFSLLGLPCVILGSMFALGCRIYSENDGDPAERIARAYTVESVGAILGGALVSYIFVPHMEASGIIFFISGLNLVGAFIMQGHELSPGVARRTRIITAVISLIALVLLLSGGGKTVMKFSIDRLWKGFDVVESKDSVYGNITVTKKGAQVSFYENGLHLYSVPDPLAAEQAAHFPLLEHKSPRDVLLIGGGVGGILKETLKHPVKTVDYVELDPLIIKMAVRDLPQTDADLLKDPRVNILNIDGRLYVKRAAKKYDCVIISLGDPYTAQLNRFYTVDFFHELEWILNPGGIVSFTLTSSPNYLGKELAGYLESVRSSAAMVFPEVMIVPGDTMIFMASNRMGDLTSDTNTLMNRMKERGIEAEYMREYYLFDVLSKERAEYALNAMKDASVSVSNTDFRPVSYYFATVFWSTQFDTPAIREFLRSVSPWHMWFLAAAACALILGSQFTEKRKKRKAAVLAALMTGGFSQIIIQITIILAFQVIYGYLFYKIGILVTSFMLGLAVGSAFAGKALSKGRDEMSILMTTQLLLCLYPLLLVPVIRSFASTGNIFLGFIGSNIVFPILPALAGIIGGLQFPAANKIYLSGGGNVGKVSGLSYGIDLLGACIGSLLASSFLIPLLGILNTCFLVTLLNFTVFTAMFLSKK